MEKKKEKSMHIKEPHTTVGFLGFHDLRLEEILPLRKSKVAYLMLPQSKERVQCMIECF